VSEQVINVPLGTLFVTYILTYSLRTHSGATTVKEFVWKWI